MVQASAAITTRAVRTTPSAVSSSTSSPRARSEVTGVFARNVAPWARARLRCAELARAAATMPPASCQSPTAPARRLNWGQRTAMSPASRSSNPTSQARRLSV